MEDWVCCSYFLLMGKEVLVSSGDGLANLESQMTGAYALYD